MTEYQKDLVKKLIETIADINEETIKDESFEEYIDQLYMFDFIQDIDSTMNNVSNLYK